MPVLKIPIVHKFGIISHSQRLALQERLLKQNYRKESEAAASSQTCANPLERCEKFVQKYNNATLDEQDRHRAEAERILVHSKRRAGVLTQGEGDHVDLAMAWSELAILAQCKGKLQEDCFEILCKSLNHAPLHEENIPTLFFLAESTLYWLRTDTVNNSYLRTAEIRLLKVGFLVFTRLYFHYLVNNLAGLDEFKTRLTTYLEGVKDHEVLYKSYPGVWLALRFIAGVGEIITASKPPKTQDSIINDTAQQQDEMTSILIRPIVYQVLHVWRCKDKGVGLKKAILDVIICAKDLAQEDWIDALFAVSILGDAAKANFLVCRSFQDIARGVTVPITALMTPRTTEAMASEFSPRKLDGFDVENPENKEERKETRGQTFQNIMTAMMADFDSSMGKTPYTQTNRREMSKDTSVRDKTEHSGTKSHVQSSNIPETSGFSPTPGQSRGSALLSNPNTPRSDISDTVTTGISAWGWEVAYQYSQIMADICLHGATASIQKVAMLGKWLGADVTTFRAGVPNFCIESCGLVDLLEYRNPKYLPLEPLPENSSSADDWSWRVRYGSLSGLLLLTHALREDKLKEGMRSAAWSLIVSLQDCPVTEDRILEALHVGQIEYPDFNAAVTASSSVNIWSRISHALTEHFLVSSLPIPRSPSSLAQPVSPGDTRQSTRRTPRMKLSPPPLPSRSQMSPRKPSPNRTTLKDHLTIPTSVDCISTDFRKRNELNLQRIIEDQWRKELIREHDQEERIKIRDLKEKQKEEETRFNQMADKRKEKLKGRPSQKLAPYEIL